MLECLVEVGNDDTWNWDVFPFQQGLQLIQGPGKGLRVFVTDQAKAKGDIRSKIRGRCDLQERHIKAVDPVCTVEDQQVPELPKHLNTPVVRPEHRIYFACMFIAMNLGK